MRSRHTLVPMSMIAVAAVAVLAAGCGGSSPTTGASASQNALAPLVAYSHCMRSHGVPSFPDPTAREGVPKDKVIRLAGSPQFQVASSACQRLMPAGGLAPPQTAQQLATRRADALSFARCMRTHGVTSFPDPSAQGELTVEMVRAQGIDIRSPAVLHDVQACLPASHGALTPASVREALNNPGG